MKSFFKLTEELNDAYDSKKDHDMDPTSHVSKDKETGKFCVYDINNKKVKEFDTKPEADAYAKKNHDALMQKEAMSPKEKAAHAKAIADFKKKGGKIKKLKPGYAQGWTGKDDLGTGQKGMLNKSDTSKFGTKKRVKSMRAHVESIELDEKVYSKPAKLDPAIAKDPKVRAAQKAHAKGDWDGNVDKEGNAVVHVKGKPHTVTVQMESMNEKRNIKITKAGKGEILVNKQELSTYLQMGWKKV